MAFNKMHEHFVEESEHVLANGHCGSVRPSPSEPPGIHGWVFSAHFVTGERFLSVTRLVHEVLSDRSTRRMLNCSSGSVELTVCMVDPPRRHIRFGLADLEVITCSACAQSLEDSLEFVDLVRDRELYEAVRVLAQISACPRLFTNIEELRFHPDKVVPATSPSRRPVLIERKLCTMLWTRSLLEQEREKDKKTKIVL